MSRLCLYAPHGVVDCMDLGCRQRGGTCEVVEIDEEHLACRCAPTLPSTNVADRRGGSQMDDLLALYRANLAQLEPCSEVWFAAALRAARAGDQNARRRIVGSCLGLALEIVEGRNAGLGCDDLLGLVEDANAWLWNCVTTFEGTTASEFVCHARSVIEARLDNGPS